MGAEVSIRRIADGDGAALRAFFERVPEGDRTFFREDVLVEGVIESWLSDERCLRFVAVDEAGVVAGYVAVLPAVGWSSHVGELRLVVDPAWRRQGVGRSLARHGLVAGLEAGLAKLVIEVVADQEAAVSMFTALGFQAEALLRDHVRAGDGELHDLVLLSHFVDENWATMRTAGIDEAVAG